MRQFLMRVLADLIVLIAGKKWVVDIKFYRGESIGEPLHVLQDIMNKNLKQIMERAAEQAARRQRDEEPQA